MTKFLKRTISIFLSFSVLAFREPTYFGCWAGQTELDDIGQSGSSGGQGDSKKEHEVKLPLLSTLPGNSSDNSTSSGNSSKPLISDEILAERAYQFKKIQSADLSRGTDNTDHSKVVVSTADFFLYPPKSVKELFEVKDKEAAFHYRDAMLRTNVAELGNDKGKVARVGILFGRSLVTAITFLAAVITLLCSVGFIEIAQNYRNQDSSELNSKELKWSNQMQIGGKIGCALSAFLALVAVYNLYALCSKTCCDCYVCKTSDAGCSCCYGCDGCDDGRGYVGCINCCGCGEKLKCCPCDNGGFALDWCGRYGIGGNCCGGTAYEEHEVNSVKSVKDFEPLIEEIAKSSEIKTSMHLRYLTMSSLTFKKTKSGYSSLVDDLGDNTIDGHMLPKKANDLAKKLRASDFYNEEILYDEWKMFEGFYREFCKKKISIFPAKSEIDQQRVIDSIYNKLYTDEKMKQLILEVCSEYSIESVGNEEIKKIIFAILAFYRYAIGEISTLDNFSKVRLCNYFNFIQAFAKAMQEPTQQKGDNHEN